MTVQVRGKRVLLATILMFWGVSTCLGFPRDNGINLPHPLELKELYSLERHKAHSRRIEEIDLYLATNSISKCHVTGFGNSVACSYSNLFVYVQNSANEGSWSCAPLHIYDIFTCLEISPGAFFSPDKIEAPDIARISRTVLSRLHDQMYQKNIGGIKRIEDSQEEYRLPSTFVLMTNMWACGYQTNVFEMANARVNAIYSDLGGHIIRLEFALLTHDEGNLTNLAERVSFEAAKFSSPNIPQRWQGLTTGLESNVWEVLQLRQSEARKTSEAENRCQFVFLKWLEKLYDAGML